MASIFDRVTTVDDELSPYDPTVDPLKQQINLISGQDPWTSYQGDWVANMNQGQLNALAGQTDFGMGGMQDYGGNLMQTGQGLLGSYGQAQDYYNRALGFDPITMAGPDMDMVARMADNPYVTGMIDSASRDISRNLYENQMPGIAASSAGAGQSGSSRRGAAEAIAARGAADRIGDISADIRGRLYSTALQNEYNRSATNADLAFKNRGQQMNAAEALRLLGGTGADLIGLGADMRRTGYEDALAAGDRTQQQAQAEIDALMAQHMLDQELPYNQAKAGIDALIEPAYRFGERETDTVEEWDGEAAIINALLTGGGTNIDFGDMLSGNFGGNATGGNASASSAAQAGGGGGDSWLDILLGGLGGIFGSGQTPPIIDETPSGGSIGDILDIVTGVIGNRSRGSTSGNNDVQVQGGTSTSPNNQVGVIDETIQDSGILDQNIQTGGDQNPQTGGNQNQGSPLDERTQQILDLVLGGMTLEEAYEAVGGAQPSGDVEVQNGTSTAPSNEVVDENSSSEAINQALEDILANSDMTDEEKEIIKGAQEEGSDQGSEEPVNDSSLVIPGFAGGNIVDGVFQDQTQTNLPQVGGPTTGGVNSVAEQIRKLQDYLNSLPSGQSNPSSIQQSDGVYLYDPETGEYIPEDDYNRKYKTGPYAESSPGSIILGGGGEGGGGTGGFGGGGIGGISAGISVGTGTQSGIGGDGEGLGNELNVLGDRGGIFSGTPSHGRMMASNSAYASAYRAAINAGYSHEEAVRKAKKASAKDK